MSQFEQIASYYNAQTEAYYLRYWGNLEFHFGLFEGEEPLDEGLERMQDVVFRPAPPQPGQIAVDAGCGVGGLSARLIQRGCRVIGLNISQVQLQMAYTRLGPNFLLADCAQPLPLASNSVDLIANFESACHFSDLSTFLSECHRILKPGGWLLGIDWMSSEGADEALLRPVIESWFLQDLRPLSRWRQLLEGVGLKAHELEDLGSQTLRNVSFLENAHLEFLLESANGLNSGEQALWIRQHQSLIEAWKTGAFIIGRFAAQKPL